MPEVNPVTDNTLGLAQRPRRWTALVLYGLGVVPFYAAHALAALQPVAAAGCLALATAALLVVIARGAGPPSGEEVGQRQGPAGQ